MKKRFALAILFLAGCAHPYTLDSLGGKPEYLNGIALSTTVSPNCVFQAGYQYSSPNEILVKVRVMNKEKAAFDVDFSSFTLNGAKETVKASTLTASDPEKYLKELAAEADLLESRTKMETFQGVEELGVLKGEKSDTQIEGAKEAYHKKMKEADTAREQADSMRKRIAIIEPAALRKTTLKSGESAEGALIFKSDFGDTGVVTLTSAIPACPAQIQFMLKK